MAGSLTGSSESGSKVCPGRAEGVVIARRLTPGIHALDHDVLAAERHGLDDLLTLQNVPDTDLLDEKELLHHHQTFLDDGDDGRVALGPGRGDFLDDATHGNAGHLDPVSVQFHLRHRVDDFGAGADPDAAGRPAPRRDRQALLDTGIVSSVPIAGGTMSETPSTGSPKATTASGCD